MAIDPVKNFAKVTVSQGYDSLAISITLNTGDGDKLPDPATDGEFNLVWWNYTDYKDPADDPNVEIVRVTAKSGDTLTITRGQEGTTPQDHNITGKTYKMVLAPTKKFRDDIKSYVDTSVAAAVLNLFLSDNSADIGGYYYMYESETEEALSELTSPALAAGNDQLLWSFVTASGVPNLDFLSLGIYTATLYLRKSGQKTVNIYWKLFKRAPDGTETELMTSELSSDLTDTLTQYLLSSSENNDIDIDPTDRLVLKIYANVSGTGTNPTVTISMEGEYDSRIGIMVASSAFKNIFVPYEGATRDVDLGSYGLATNSLTIGSLDGVLKASSGVVSGGAELNDLADVSISSPIAGQILRCDGANWVNTSDLFIDADGKIGIGTTEPSKKLDISTTTDWDGLRVSGSLNTQLIFQSGAGYLAQMAYYQGETTRFSQGVNPDGTLFYFDRFDDTGAWVGTALAIRRSNGNVGIGTTSPGAKLDVVGNINASGTLTLGTPLGAAYGGTGLDTSALTGIPKVTSGTWSVDAGLNDLGDVSISSPSGGQGLIYNSTTGKWENKDDINSITFVIDGGGSAIETGEKGHLRIPFDCEIQSVALLADQSGSIQIDIWKDTYANFPPTSADSICGGNKPAISSAQKYEDTTLSGWTKTINAGDVLAFNVDSCDTITRVTIALKVKKI